MTIKTKSSLLVKKPLDAINSTLADEEAACDEDKVEINSAEWMQGKRASGLAALLCMSVAAMVIAVTGITCGLLLYRQYLLSNTLHRYQGFCSIPIDFRRSDPEFLPKPLFWSLRGPEFPDLSAAPDGLDDNNLNEEVDIDGDSETISVFENGRQINFIHDFENNVTGIVDEDRCYLMQLERSVVLPPDVFVLRIAAADDMDVSRVRVSLRAALPALIAPPPPLPARCQHRPVYRLLAAPTLMANSHIRKRSVDDPKADYMQFSGKHVQEIEISNLADVLQYESDHKQ